MIEAPVPTSRPASFKVTAGVTTRVVMTGEFDRSTTLELHQQLEQLLDGSPIDVDFDLKSVEFIDSGGLEILLLAYRRIVTEGGGTVRVTSTSAAARRTFELAGLLEAFNFDGPA
jgi:anti-anti-sigma factor